MSSSASFAARLLQETDKAGNAYTGDWYDGHYMAPEQPDFRRYWLNLSVDGEEERFVLFDMTLEDYWQRTPFEVREYLRLHYGLPLNALEAANNWRRSEAAPEGQSIAAWLSQEDAGE